MPDNSPGVTEKSGNPDLKLVLIQVTLGEFLDRYSIAKIKAKKFDGSKLKQVTAEIQRLNESVPLAGLLLNTNPMVAGLYEQLLEANETLWAIEDQIRLLDSDVFPVSSNWIADGNEHYQEDLLAFLNLARSVYLTNDRRTKLKAQINQYFNTEPEAREYPDVKP